MGARGPLPQPDNVRRLRGNPGRRNPPGPPRAVAASPSPPSWLDPEAKAEWRRITPELARLRVISALDRAALAVYCDAWSRWVQARKLLEASGLIVKGRNRGGGDVKSPAWTVYAQAAGLVASAARELGLSPASRMRLSVYPDDEDTSDLD